MFTTKSLTNDSAWKNYESLAYHTGLLKKGIVAVVPYKNKKMSLEKKQVDNERFVINDRNFYFDTIRSPKEDKNCSKIQDSQRNKNAHNSRCLLNQLTTYNPQIKTSRLDQVIYNKEHREETFMPFIVNPEKNAGLYLYPWLSQKLPFEFTGFEQFVTAGCLFGSSLKGMDQQGATFPLIKHDIKFFDGQCIEAIIVDEEANSPYEAMLFEQFKMFTKIIDHFSETGKMKKLLYHLPYYDYMLFGIELYLRQRITVDALCTLFDFIIERKDRHEVKIQQICQKHAIEVIIESPFENLFNESRDEKISSKKIFDKMIQMEAEFENKSFSKTLPDKEAWFVHNYLGSLIGNSYNQLHQTIWKTLITLSDQAIIKNMDELFKIANTFMVTKGAYGKQNFKVCSLLPLSEKQIQVGYANFCKKMKETPEKALFPSVFNITTLDNLITYGPKTQGLPFYFNHCEDDLANFIMEEKVLKKAYKNIGQFFKPLPEKGSNVLDEPDLQYSSPRIRRLL